MRTTLLILFTALIFTSCDETKKVIDAAGNVQLSGTYVVQSIDGKKIANNEISLSFSALNKSFSGQTGCNSVLSDYTLDLYALYFGELAVTERYCDQPVMDLERDYLNALQNTGSYGLSEGILTLYSATDRSVLLTAKKQERQ